MNKIRTLSQLHEWLNYERTRYNQLSFFKYVLQANEHAIIWKHQRMLRITEYFINSKHKILSIIMRFRLNQVQNKYSIHIPPNVCGKGLKLLHVGPILINGNAKVGENCVFHINTALVAGGHNEGAPVLGNNVIMGYGSVVLGETYVSDGIAIGANAVVNKSVTKKNVAIAGVPAKIISNNGSDTWNKTKS